MRLATWNVNSLKVRLPQVLQWLAVHQPDVLCLQETKLADAYFPAHDIRAAGYHTLISGQKTYNGVAILRKVPASSEQGSRLRDASVRESGTAPSSAGTASVSGVASPKGAPALPSDGAPAADALTAIPGFNDPQKRVLAASLGGLRVVCLYVPNGQSISSDKYRYKLDWLAAATAWLKRELAAHPRLVVVGDFNIAPDERDVHDPKAWEGQVLFSAPERQAFQDLLAIGLRDSFRLFEQPAQSFSWWDYRMNAFKRKMGLRIDHILLSDGLSRACRACTIDSEPRKAERPSDHAPVIAELSI